eukprot:GHVU01135323.1.p1 GENE.GHVU01135323.1~~GHVU01135323.1.p1  ORF type:complete len:104 (+),score=9.16 GHVU01135323.1:1388-1699(+)
MHVSLQSRVMALGSDSTGSDLTNNYPWNYRRLMNVDVAIQLDSQVIYKLNGNIWSAKSISELTVQQISMAIKLWECKWVVRARVSTEDMRPLSLCMASRLLVA